MTAIGLLVYSDLGYLVHYKMITVSGFPPLYTCIYIYAYVDVYVCMHVCSELEKDIYTNPLCMFVRRYVCMHACMYV